MNDCMNGEMNKRMNECGSCSSENSTFIAQIYENNNLFE